MFIAICEDNKNDRERLMSLLKRHRLKVYSSSRPFMFEYEDYQNKFDMVILDIEMPPGEANGIQVGRFIREKDENIPIVFITDHLKYAVPCYEVHPYHYLLKRAPAEKLLKIVDEVENKLHKYWNDCLNIKTRGGFIRLPKADIFYLEGFYQKLLIHTADVIHERYNVSIEGMLLELNDVRFFQTHKSYAVNIDKLERAIGNYTMALLTNGDTVPIRRRLKPEVIKYLAGYGVANVLGNE